MIKVAQLKDGRKAVIMRTSDSMSFKRCRRQWAWSSHLMGNLGPNYLASPLWFGSAIHYALEDYHGYRHFDSPADAFRAYCIATSKQHLRDLPSDAEELYRMGVAMMDYYVNYWLAERPVDETYWEIQPDGSKIPQVEVNFEVEVPLEENPLLAKYAAELGADCVLYRGTIDRVGEDEYGRLWLIEYKTAKVLSQTHFATDPQVTRYIWAMKHVYPGKEIAGVVYQQFIKKVPQPPKPLASGKYSTAKNQTTSSSLYKAALINMYGTLSKAPEENRNYVTYLMQNESRDHDKFVVRDYITRNEHMMAMEAQKVLLELEDIMNPNLPLYPNPTRDCAHMCSFNGACVSFDDGSDWQSTLDGQFASRDQGADRLWRKRLPEPKVLAELRNQQGVPDLEDMQIRLQKLPKEDQEKIERGEKSIGFTFNM